MKYTYETVDGHLYGADHTMFDHAAGVSGWYWPSRHDYYIYDAPPRIPNIGGPYTYLRPKAINRHFMKPLSNYTDVDDYNYHPHQAQYPDGSYELDLYPDDEIPNLSSVSVQVRKQYTVPNGGPGVTHGDPRYVLVSPNVALCIKHFYVEPRNEDWCHPSPCGMEGRTGGMSGRVFEFMVEADPVDGDDVGAVFIQKAVVKEYYGVGNAAEDYGWDSLGYPGELTFAFLDWTEVYGPVNWQDMASLDQYTICQGCDVASSRSITHDPNYEDYFGNEFQLSAESITSAFRTDTSSFEDVTFTIQDKFKFPLIPPRMAQGADPLIDILKQFPMFAYDQDTRIIIGTHRWLGFPLSDPLNTAYYIRHGEGPDLLDFEMGATFDIVSPGAYSGDSSTPWFSMYPSDEWPNNPMIFGMYDGGDFLSHQLPTTLEWLKGHAYELVADGTQRHLNDDVVGEGGLNDRRLSREFFGVQDCDHSSYPPCLYNLNINQEYRDSFIDAGKLVSNNNHFGGEYQRTPTNNINTNLTLVYGTTVTAAGIPENNPMTPVDPKIFRIEHSDPSTPSVTDRTFFLDELKDHINGEYENNIDKFWVLFYGIKPAKPQEIGNYVYVAIAGSDSDGGDPVDTGRVVILNKNDLSNTVAPVPVSITGAETAKEMFGTEMATNGKELFISASANNVEQYTGIDPKVYVYEPLHTTSGELTAVNDIQTIDAVSHIENDRFGYSLDATDNWLVIGSPGTESYADEVNNDPPAVAGKIHIYKKNTTGTWDLHTTIDSSSTINDEQLNTDSFFGHSVSINGDLIAVGCPRDKETIDGETDVMFGSVFIFKYDSTNNTWSYDQKISFEDLYIAFVDLDDPDYLRSNFGWKVQLGPKTLLVSGLNMESEHSGFNTDAGIAILFSKESGLFIPKDLFDGLSFQYEGLGKYISLYEETDVDDDTQVTKRVISLSKIKKSLTTSAEHNKATVYILKSTDETNVNEPPGNSGDQDGDYEGYFDNPDDRVLSGRAVIQDSNIWQDYSYVLNAASPGSSGSTGDGTAVILEEEWVRPFGNFMHPAGLKFFGMATLDDVVGGGVPTSGVVSLETGIIAHYMPYTFNTKQNLRFNENQADLYPQGFNANATGASYGADDGYTNDDVYATMPENAPYGITHINLGFPYGISGSSFGYSAADLRSYPYWMIFNHPNIWASNVTGPSGSPESSGGYTLGSAVSFGSIVLDNIISMDIDITKIQTNAPGALLQSPNIGNLYGATGNPLIYGLADGPTGGNQY